MLSLAALAFLASSLAGRASANHADPSQSQYASLWTGLDQKCQGSIAALVSDTSDFAKCSGSSKLFGDLVSSAAVDENASLTPHIKSWLTGSLCVAKGCSNDVVQAAYKNVTESCGSDTKENNIIPLAVQGILLNYDTVRTAACLKTTKTKSGGDFCPIVVLTGVEEHGTPISYGEVQTVLSAPDPETCVENIADEAMCTDCLKGMYSEVLPALKLMNDDWAKSASGFLSDMCGADFVDGATPSDVSDGIPQQTQTSTSANAGQTGGAGGGKGGDSAGGDSSAAVLGIKTGLVNAFGVLLAVTFSYAVSL